MRLLVAADHDRQRSCLHLGNASRHGSIEHRRSLVLHLLRDFTAYARADRAHVDPDLRFGEAREDPVGPRRDALEDVVVRNRRDQDVGGLGDLARCVTPLQPVVEEIVCIFAVARLAVDGVSGGEEPGGHVSAHVPQADNADLCGRGGHLMHSLRSTRCHRRRGRGWPHRRSDHLIRSTEADAPSMRCSASCFASGGSAIPPPSEGHRPAKDVTAVSPRRRCPAARQPETLKG